MDSKQAILNATIVSATWGTW